MDTPDPTSTRAILDWSNKAISDLQDLRRNAEHLQQALYRKYSDDNNKDCYSEVNACQAVMELAQAMNTALWTVRYRALERNPDEKIG